LTGTDPTAFSVCGLDLEDPDANSQLARLWFSFVLVQSGLLGLPVATVVGLGAYS
jgi:hypothetical protein